MKKGIIVLTTMLIVIGCSKNNEIIDQLWGEAEALRQQENLGAAISKLIEIKENYPKSSKAAEAQFMIGEIYLNDVKNYEISIEEFQTVIRDYPKSEMAEKAMFMVGYIYTNYLQAFSDGIEYYQKFLEEYPESELVDAVNYELNTLEDVKSQINDLANSTDNNLEDLTND
ncbi:MAG: outer membrane protein assembly factor BamD [Fidelibacterota bacterium]